MSAFADAGGFVREHTVQPGKDTMVMGGGELVESRPIERGCVHTYY